MEKIEFYGFLYKQNSESPSLFAFVGDAQLLKKICGVARKGQHNLTNYQRSLDETRVVKDLEPFFKNPENCSPTAIIVSLHETSVCKIDIEDIPGFTPSSSALAQLKKLVINYTDTSNLNKEQIINLMKEFLDARLATDVSASEDTEDSTSDIDDEEELTETEDEEEDNLEISTSKMREMRKVLDTPDKVSDSLLEVYKDMLKPALVIDGQHRLFGAAKLEEEIPFLVCAIVEPEWKEEVFQFTVINSKAKKIPTPFITSLMGMSLTQDELDSLSERLDHAGIHLWEVDVMKRLGLDPKSPFYNMIDYKVNQKSNHGVDGLAYETMKPLGKMWFEGGTKGNDDGGFCLLKIVNKILDPTGDLKIKKKTLLDTLQDKKYLYWYRFLLDFWIPVKDKFIKKWTIGSGELMKQTVVLLQFQRAFLKILSANYDLVFADLDLSECKSLTEKENIVFSAYRKIVKIYIDKFNDKHFSKPFRSSLNQSDGMEDLLDYFTKIYNGTSVSNHKVFKN